MWSCLFVFEAQQNFRPLILFTRGKLLSCKGLCIVLLLVFSVAMPLDFDGPYHAESTALASLISLGVTVLSLGVTALLLGVTALATLFCIALGQTALRGEGALNFDPCLCALQRTQSRRLVPLVV